MTASRPGTDPRTLPARLQRRSALFQQWQALLTNRSKRHRRGEMIVQGVRPITLALQHGIPARAVLVDDRPQRSNWAQRILEHPPAPVVELSAELLAELGQREDGPPELLLLAAVPRPRLADLAAPGGLLVVLDRPTSPGNIGTLSRTADALGADALIVTGHSADPWDPAAVRAGTGSMFALPVVQAPSPQEVLASLPARTGEQRPWQVIGLDEAGGHLLERTDLRGSAVLVIGNETAGMSAAWREVCDTIAEIPMGGSASSLNAAVAGSIALYETGRQRGTGR